MATDALGTTRSRITCSLLLFQTLVLVAIDEKRTGVADDDKSSSMGNAERLSRVFFLVGQVAMKLLVLLETAEGDIKRLKSKAKAQGGAPVAAAAAPAAEKKPKEKAKPKKKKKADSDDDSEPDDEEDKDASEASDADDSDRPKPVARAKKAAKAAETSAPVAVAAAEEKKRSTSEKKESTIEDELAVGASEDYELEILRDRAEKYLVQVPNFALY